MDVARYLRWNMHNHQFAISDHAKAMTTLEQFNEEVKKEILNGAINNPGEDLQDFITQKLTEHKALILKMVREKLLKDERFDTLDCDRIEDHIDEIKNFH